MIAAPTAAANDDANPVPGTLGWIKWAAKQDTRASAVRTRLRAM